jgi:D-alanine-D-alanine ligase
LALYEKAEAMRVAIVYNRDSKNVINVFGIPNQERIGLKTIKRISEALKVNKHRVKTIEADKDLVTRLEEFMPRVVKGERPGLVFNVSYGIQGQSRYAHVPSILEMVGIPYVGSGPLAHGLALDKVIAKMLFSQHGLPTPDFVVLNPWECFPPPNLLYPLVVKPKHEAVSFGLKVVYNETELQTAVANVYEAFNQPVLVEHFVQGREINVGLIGNNRPEAFSPVELTFPQDGPPIYTFEDKTQRSGRKIGFECPASLSPDLSRSAQELAQQAFEALGCYDCARVDMRLDEKGNLYLLEVNSLPSLGEHGSYTIGAKQAGLDYQALVNRLVEVASARYFGTPKPIILNLNKSPQDIGHEVLSVLSERRDQIERRLRFWTNTHSRSSDAVGIREAVKKLGESLTDIGLKRLEQFTDDRFIWTWGTKAGLSDGILLIGHIDVPLSPEVPVQEFRRDPEWLHGEGIGTSRGPLVMLESVLKALRSLRRLQKIKLGVLYYGDEGQDCIHSTDIIRKAAAHAKQVLILRPGNLRNKVITQRRGQRKYRLRVEGTPTRIGKFRKRLDVLRWLFIKLESLSQLSSQEDRITIATNDIQTTNFPMLLPHLVMVTLLVSYADERMAAKIEEEIRETLGKEGPSWKLELVSDRPDMKKRDENRKLVKQLSEIAAQWEIPFDSESSLWPSVGGLIPNSAGVVCGIGPVAKNLCTPQETVQRISMMQRALLLAEFLVRQQ